MAQWPTSNRVKPKTCARMYPSVEPGMLGAATLVDTNGRLSWQFLTQGSRYTLEKQRDTALFPATRFPEPKIPRTSTRRRAEEGANFLRNLVPDADIPAEIIREYLVEETLWEKELSVFDPSLGNVLAALPQEEDVLCMFPTGASGQELNVSMFTPEFPFYTFRPHTIPCHVFPTPIQQICVAPTEQRVVLGVRTFGHVHFLELHRDKKERPLISPLFEVAKSGLGNNEAVDLCFLPTSNTVAFITERGSIYQWSSTTLTSVLPVDESSPSRFWRVVKGELPETVYRLGEKAIDRIDLRTNTADVQFSMQLENNVLTSIDSQDDVIQLCSTERLLWLDPRFTARPLLSYAHRRQYDRYLKTDTYGNVTLLSTRTNNLVTVYDVTRSGDLIQVLDEPRDLVLGENTYDHHLGFAPVEQLRGLLSLSTQGALTFTGVGIPSSDPPIIEVHGSKELDELKEQEAVLNAKPDPLDEIDTSHLNMEKLRKELYYTCFDSREALEEEQKEAIYNVIESVPDYWKTKDEPLDVMLTTRDIAFRAGQEPSKTPKVDFLANSLINSKRGYRALQQDRLSADRIYAPWKFSISDTLKCLEPGMETDPSKVEDYVRSFEEPESEDSATRRRQSLARRELAVDLALSADVFSEHRVASHERPLEAMAEALSLEGPPPIQWHYFRPVDESGATTSTGLRLLMKEWDEQPVDDYVYRDPYGENESADSAPPIITRARETQSQTQRPPEIVATVAPVETQESQPLEISTQIVAGPYGGRPSVQKKKKRVGGF